jgi:hypothetical protein
MGMIAGGSLVPQPDFQRRLVWTDRHKQLFIQTVLDNMPFPEIFLCDGEVDLNSGVGNQLIVDGQQRVTTLYQYFTASVPLKLGSIKPYRALEDAEKKVFLEYSVVVRDLGALGEEEVREIFRRMNSTNYSLNAMEVNNARYDGALKKTAEQMSEWEVLDSHRVFNTVDIRRMTDVRWCLDVIITVISGYFSRSETHEEFLETYNDEFPQAGDVTEKLSHCFELLDQLKLEDKSRAWQKNDLFTLAVEIYHLDPRNCTDNEGLSDTLKTFFADVSLVAKGKDPLGFESARQYHTDVISGSNERARRIRRGEMINSIISGFFRDPDENKA